MRIFKTGLLVTTLLTAALLPASAGAAVITENLTFNLTGFLDITAGSNIAAPNPVVTGSITVTYDPTLTYNNDTTDIVVNYLTGVTVDSALGFTYASGELGFGGIANNADFVSSNTNDIVVSFNVTDPAHPTFIPCSTPGFTCGQYTGSSAVDAAGYTLAAYSTGWFYGVQSTVTPDPPAPTPTPTPSTTPEPASMAMIGIGFSALALVARRIKR